MADLEKLVDDLSALTVLEAAELAKLLEEKWASRLLLRRSRSCCWWRRSGRCC